MYGCGNFGDDLILINLVKYLRNKYRNSKIYVLSGANKSALKINSENVYIVKAPKYSNLIKRILFHKKMLVLFKNIDTLIIGGGGLLQDSHSLFTAFTFLKYVRYINNECKVIGVGLGVGPIENEFTKKYIRKYFKYIDHTQVRDEESKIVLERIVNAKDNKISVSCDIVLGTDIKDLFPSSKNDKMLIGVSIRPTPNINCKEIAKKIYVLYKALNLDVILFIFEDNIKSHIELNFNRKVLEYLKYRKVKCEISNYIDDKYFLEKLSKVKYAIASRYHANIIWQKLGAFVMPIEYAPKVSSLYKKYQNISVKKEYICLNLNNEKYSIPNISNYKMKKIRYIDMIYFYYYTILECFSILFGKVKRKSYLYGFRK